MNVNRQNHREILLKDKIDTWKRASHSKLKEADIVRELQLVTANGVEQSGITDHDYIDLLALAAFSRYQRIQSADPKMRAWLNEAWEMDKDHPFLARIYVDIFFPQLNKAMLPTTLPRIRETDHGQGKKNTIDRIVTAVEETSSLIDETLIDVERLEKAANLLDKQSQYEKISEVKRILTNMKAIARQLCHTAQEYKETISGIYYSKEKQAAFNETFAEFDHVQEKWDKLREEMDFENKNPLTELYSMIGLEEVKLKVHQYYYYLRYEQERKKQGYLFQDERNLNMIFTGNPGTGKTTIARLLAKIYHDLGVLPKEKVVEVDRSHLVGAYLGQTEEKTTEVIKQAIGGVLFIDEAYSLKREGASGNDYGQTAIDTLVSSMTSGEYAGKFSVILAGYPEEMRTFLWANPGLRSRFPESNHIHIHDFSLNELLEIAEQIALDNDFTISDEGMVELKRRIEKEQVDESFGNARTVKNIVLDAIFNKGAKTGETKDYTKENFTILTKDDFVENEEFAREEISGEEQLQNLIGLHDVKKEVKTLTSFVKIQKMREEQQLPKVPLQLHAVFSGPPGTGKTTVAKIYGKILHEIGLLKRGHLVVAGRSDLVAGYVGQTAIKTKQKIKEALGGVLFIDEAYSLLSKSEQDFGKEAIDTLVEEMTKHEDHLVVILAGYTEKIEQLLHSNPGLPSRFKKMIPFPQYTTEELINIVKYYIYDYNYTIDENTIKKLANAVEKKRPSGNARAMKDLVEEAIKQQAYRIATTDAEEINTESLKTLTEGDFQIFTRGVEEDEI